MADRRLVQALCAAAPFLLLAAAPAAAQAPRLHTGSTRYVRLVHLRDGDLTIALTAEGRKQLRGRLRGRVLDASCTTLGRSVQGFSQSTGSGGSVGTFGPHGRVSYHTVLDPHADFCDVGLARQTITRHGVSTSSEPGPPFDSIALTPKGAAYLDEDRVTERMLSVLNVASELAGRDPAGHFPAAAKAAKLLALFGVRVVALASPDASPPAGVVGFFSDGVDHAEVVALSALAHRLFIDSSSGVLSTNAQEHLFRVTSGQLARLPG